MKQNMLIKNCTTVIGMFVVGLILTLTAYVLFFIGVSGKATSYLASVILGGISALLLFVTTHSENGWIRMISALVIALDGVVMALSLLY